MMLYFEHSDGSWTPICDCADKIDVYAAIRRFVNQQNEKRPPDKQFKIYYWRSWDSGGYMHFDVGSWNEFFHWGP